MSHDHMIQFILIFGLILVIFIESLLRGSEGKVPKYNFNNSLVE